MQKAGLNWTNSYNLAKIEETKALFGNPSIFVNQPGGLVKWTKEDLQKVIDIRDLGQNIFVEIEIIDEVNLAYCTDLLTINNFYTTTKLKFDHQLYFLFGCVSYFLSYTYGIFSLIFIKNYEEFYIKVRGDNIWTNIAILNFIYIVLAGGKASEDNAVGINYNVGIDNYSKSDKLTYFLRSVNPKIVTDATLLAKNRREYYFVVLKNRYRLYSEPKKLIPDNLKARFADGFGSCKPVAGFDEMSEQIAKSLFAPTALTGGEYNLMRKNYLKYKTKYLKLKSQAK